MQLTWTKARKGPHTCYLLINTDHYLGSSLADVGWWVDHYFADVWSGDGAGAAFIAHLENTELDALKADVLRVLVENDVLHPIALWMVRDDTQ